ncbi:MAG: NAD(P)-dependent oxidoreductase [Paludibacter sp.]|nr:NAD(P)-dependent oxidoreductase [Paludibacter sp.]
MKILLTGATGFLGSHIAEALLEKGHELILTRRANSNLWRCNSFVNNVLWVNTDSNSWITDVCTFSPEIIINSAWNGVSSSNRDDWESQLSNIDYMYFLLRIAKECCIDKFISMGSQAEYGQFEGKISEDYPLNPTTSYGAVKLAASRILKMFCEDNNIKWYWLRVFSVFGEREDEKWLIPSVIKTMLTEQTEMNFTACEQKYAYLYVRDFAQSITNVVIANGSSGIYNLSSDSPLSLKDILGAIKDIVNPYFKLNFGQLAYRENQSMHIEGDATKFNETFGKIDSTDFEVKLTKVIDFYKY